MVAHIHSIAFEGVEVLDVEIQVQIAGGLPAFNIVGLPDKAVAESKERVRSALHAMGLSLPAKRITINLAPADVLKEGSHYDLPIALGLLCAMDVVPNDAVARSVILGELGLDGGIRPAGGILPAALHALSMGYNIICAAQSGSEARWAGDIDILAAPNLLSLINHFKGTNLISPIPAPSNDDLTAQREANNASIPDLSAIKGQESAKRALMIAAAGGHNLLMVGPPGSGKSMLAAALPGLLPDLSSREALETSIIHSISGILPKEGLVTQRPFRNPHHSATLPALIGGGTKAKPGELSLAHNGVLFLDELPEFARNTLESLRQPIESGEVVIARANHHLSYPAQTQLLAAMNPCRCGYLGQTERECNKAPRCGQDYQSKISGPMLDRFDLHVDVPAVSYSDLSLPAKGMTSDEARQIVQACRDIQIQRNGGKTNAQLSPAEIDTTIILTPTAKTLMEKAAISQNLSGRGYHRVLKSARTITDMLACQTTTTSSPSTTVDAPALAEALSYRHSA